MSSRMVFSCVGLHTMWISPENDVPAPHWTCQVQTAVRKHDFMVMVSYTSMYVIQNCRTVLEPPIDPEQVGGKPRHAPTVPPVYDSRTLHLTCLPSETSLWERLDDPRPLSKLSGHCARVALQAYSSSPRQAVAKVAAHFIWGRLRTLWQVFCTSLLGFGSKEFLETERRKESRRFCLHATR